MKYLLSMTLIAAVFLTKSTFAGEYAFTVVDTGQTACYDNSSEITCPKEGEAFYGQDAQYDSAQFSLQDNEDGTISDINTGLMWQQTPSSSSFNWQEAVDHCDTLVLAGHDDWRIPSLKELFSISNFSQGWPYLDTAYFDIAGGSVSKDEQYWTSNYYVGVTSEGGSAAAFGVNHGTGHIKAYPAGVSGPMGNYVRAVRGNSYGANQFTDNGDGTVTDTASGLTWQQEDSASGLDWEEALAYAEDLELADYDDWRLPDVKELQSIVDYTRSPSATDASDEGPAINTDYFDITELVSGTTDYNPDYGYFWSSTSAYFSPASPEYYYAWYVAFGTAVDDYGEDTHGAGAVRNDTKVEGGPSGEGGERIYNYVRCVQNTSAAPTPTPPSPILDSGDYNGDGTDDIAIFRSSSGLWAVRDITRAYFGSSSDMPVPGDYDGDEITDIGIFRGSSGLWAVKGVTRVYFGSTDDIPVPFSSNPSSACLPGIFRETSGLWALRGLTRVYFGSSGDRPVPGDYDGDGTRDIGIFRNSSGLWAIRDLTRVYFGSSADTAVHGDYSGSGVQMVGIFRPASGLWAIRGVTRSYFGASTDDPVPADYNGDGADDIGIFRASSGLWAIKGASRVYFGSSGDIPVVR